MQQQLAPARGLVIGVAAVAVRTDVDVVDPDLAAFDAREAVAQVGAPFADRLHLGAEQRHAGLEGLEHVVVVVRLPVVGDDLLRLFALGLGHRVDRVAAARRAASRIGFDEAGRDRPSPRPAMSKAVP